MTLLAFPPDLPRPNRDGWQVTRQDGRLRRSAEAGPPGYRRRSSGVVRAASLSIDMTRHQKAIFWTFFDTTTEGGALPFTMPDPTTDGWPMLDGDGAPLLDEDDTPLLLSATWTCLFGDAAPTESIVRPLLFRISFSVTVLP